MAQDSIRSRDYYLEVVSSLPPNSITTTAHGITTFSKMISYETRSFFAELIDSIRNVDAVIISYYIPNRKHILCIEFKTKEDLLFYRLKYDGSNLLC
jgi:hypothetical protein